MAAKQLDEDAGPSYRIDDDFLIAVLIGLLAPYFKKQAKEMAHEVLHHHPALIHEKVTDCLSRRSVGAPVRAQIADAAATILGQRLASVVTWLRSNQESDSADHLQAVIKKRRPMLAAASGLLAPPEQSPASQLFENWQTKSRERDFDRRLIRDGIYQLFRRYKPLDGQNSAHETEFSDPNNHYLIVELCYLTARRSVIITSELRVYSGTVFINHERILSALLQRPVVREGDDPAFNHRFVELKLRRPILPFYSGLMIKVGDTTERPISSECIFLEVPPEQHPELDSALAELLSKEELPISVHEDSIFADYVTSNPPRPGRRADPKRSSRSYRLKEFPFFAPLIQRRGENKPPLFREPSRTLEDHDIQKVEGELEVFRHSTRQARTTD